MDLSFNQLRKPLNFALQIKDFLIHRKAIKSFVHAAFAIEDTWVDSGSVKEVEYPLLKELCQKAGEFDGPIVEIGTLFGFATTKLALWKKPQQKIITVDNYCWNPIGLPPRAHLQLTTRVLEYLRQTGQVELLNIDKSKFFRDFKLRPAMVFLDADHSYEETKKDILWALGAKAPIISGHDYSDLCPGVKKAVDEFGGPDQLLGSVWTLKA